ncbi:DNA internalization-related competence protein ComEC/Rec2 [Gandjariella thermophila]|nr:DNA internalization-related competence protein ComEC/Rec2 [Gandjariella thermophila]
MTDVRLVPAAMAVWSAALLGLRAGWPFALLCGAVAATVAVALLRRDRWHRAAALALLAGGLAGGGWMGHVAHQAATHPLRAAAQRGAAATLRVELTDRPRPLRSAGFGGRQGGVDRVAASGRLVSGEVAGEPLRAGGQVLLLAPAAGWQELLPEQEVTAGGLLAPSRGGDLTVAVLRVRGRPADLGPAPPWQRAAESVRAGLRRASRVLAPEPAALLPGLVLGDTGALPERIAEEWEAAGLTHLIAVSGANLVIICGTVLVLLRMARAGPRLTGALGGLAVAGFVLLAGPEPSVLRAAAMGAIGLLALVLGREHSTMPALAASVILLLFLDPDLGASAGFALSVLATAGLVVLAPRWIERLRRGGVSHRVAEAVAVPMAAHLVTAPVVAGLAGHVSLVAVAANALAEPAVPPATVLGVLAAVCAQVHQGTAEFLVRLAGPELHWMILVGRRAAEIPGAVIPWPRGWGGGLLLAAVLAVAVALVRLRRIRLLLTAALAGVVVVLLPTRLVVAGWPASGWAVVACDVGQGDAVALATADRGRAVLVDTGPEPGAVAGCLHRLGVRSVALVVLTHLHADHIGGLSAVLEEHTVAAVALGPVHEPAWAWQQVREETAAAGVPLVELSAGHRLAWPGLTLDVLAPRDGVRLSRREGDDGTAINDASVVLRADTAVGRVLLTGDVELAGQEDLLDSGLDLRADILKVPHHGSRYSSPQFLAAVRPRVALVSVGAGNPYGHPSPMLLDALNGAGVMVARTDRDGDTAVVAARDGPAVARRGEPRPPPRR